MKCGERTKRKRRNPELERAIRVLFDKARKWEELTGLPGDCYRAWAVFLKWMAMFPMFRDPTLFWREKEGVK